MSATPAPEFSFAGSDSRLARFLTRPVRRFLHIEASSGLLMLGATIFALVWANSRWSSSYSSFWHTSVDISIGSFQLGGGHQLDLQALVNDGLMAVFFFVVGLEIKRELVTGQLRTAKAAALPAFAALGGMVIPAGIFLMFSAGTDAEIDGKLDQAVLLAALQDTTRLEDLTETPLIVTIALSQMRARTSELAELVLAELDAKAISPDRTSLEISETDTAALSERSIEQLRRLHDAGLTLTINCFGAGKVGLRSLRSLPISQLKLDDALVADIADNDASAAIASTTIELAHHYGLRRTQGPARRRPQMVAMSL